MKRNRHRYVRIAAALVVALLSIVVLVIPASAAASPLPSTDTETLVVPTTYQFPIVDGESLGAVDDVYMWYGIEYTAEGVSDTMASLGFRAAACTSLDGFYTFDNTSVEVFTYHKQSNVGLSPWECITDATLSTLGADTLSGRFYNNDGSAKSGTYGEAFADLAVSYSLSATSCDAFAVRWKATNADGVARKYCYIGILTHIESNPAADHLDPSARCPFVWYVGLMNTGVAYRLGVDSMRESNDALYDECRGLEARIEQLEHENLMLSDSIKIASESGYNQGYQDGLSASGGDLGIDTSTPWSTVISFVSALFIGLRNLTSPILAVEIAGISLGTFLGVLVAFSVVSVIIVVVINVKG